MKHLIIDAVLMIDSLENHFLKIIPPSNLFGLVSKIRGVYDAIIKNLQKPLDLIFFFLNSGRLLCEWKIVFKFYWDNSSGEEFSFYWRLNYQKEWDMYLKSYPEKIEHFVTFFENLSLTQLP